MKAEACPLEDDGIENRVAFDQIRYGNCWEDADVLCEALRPSDGARILSIASAGDNVLALAAEGAKVVAADVSNVQLACLELRCAAFRQLDYCGLLAFLGIQPSRDRLVTYSQLQNDLSPQARHYWSGCPQQISGGIIHVGKFEAYFRLFRTRVLPLIHSRRTVEQLLEPKELPARRHFYERTWSNTRWRLLFRLFFSRLVMGHLGRDPEFFRYVEGSVADRVLERAQYALTMLPTHDNPYLSYIVTGNYTHSLPRYLRPENFEAVKNGLQRITLFHGPIDKAAVENRGAGFDGYNLSDIFEYLDTTTSERVFRRLATAAKRGARMAYWNTFVPRRCPLNLARRVVHQEELSQQLFARDRAFFYCAFCVDEVW